MGHRRLAVIAAVVLVTATACGPPADEEPAEPIPSPTPDEPETETAEFDPLDTAFGEQVDLLDGLTLETSDLVREANEDGESYASWEVTLTNTTGGDLPLTAVTFCRIGEEPEESDQPGLGEAPDPPVTAPHGETATWNADCWIPVEETALQYSIMLTDDDMPITPELTFAGEVEPPPEPEPQPVEDAQPEVPQQWVEEGFWDCVAQNNFDDCYWKWTLD